MSEPWSHASGAERLRWHSVCFRLPKGGDARSFRNDHERMQENLAMSHQFRGADQQQDALARVARSTEELIRLTAADPLLTGAVASMGLALGLQLRGHSRAARFVGLLAPTLLLVDLYQRATSSTPGDEAQGRHDAALDFERRFEGGCASLPDEWEETIDDTHRMTASRDPDDYSERISRVAPLKAK